MMARNELKNRITWKKDIKQNWGVYLLFLPAFVLLLVFNYIPMYGITMAFQNVDKYADSIFGSDWVGFQNFINLFTADGYFLIALRNTVCIGLLKLTIGFISPIIFAILLSLLCSKRFKRLVQTFSYMPNFVAAVVVASLLTQFVGKNGPLTLLLGIFGVPNQNLLALNSPAFWFIYTFMGIWQGIGWGSIMYVASIATVSGDLHEAAAIDGATRLQRMFKITVPCIMPMIVMMFVMNVGLSFTVGYDSILLLYMPTTYDFSDTIYTYTYRWAGFSGGSADYGLSAASGLFQSVVGTILLVGSNWASRKMIGTSLF